MKSNERFTLSRALTSCNGVSHNETMKRKRTPGEKRTGGVVAVVRALAIFDAFGANESTVTLGELARRTRLHKSTALRLARTLAATGYLVQIPEGPWRLGPAVGWLGARYHSAFDTASNVEPVLRELSRVTGESAAFFIREGKVRVCVARVDGPQPLRHHVRLGESLPLNRGALGRVLLAFSGESGALYERIRRAGYHTTRGERDPQLAGVAFPVHGPNRCLIGCVGVSGPIARFSRAACARHVQALRKATAQLTFKLGGSAADIHAHSE